ncbi:hypothetical protein H5P28_07130 [Ruficoccus amylovorans]|uniref:Replication protein n=1 Tax=Ruficoccus amylovorans TaxID=1804625 RepID=A0A842HC87_9BACT|nr:hypothetical protein [Ruficoccus amylovorans]MBC2594032.1 hypothetical protein [Ruficoccus amylovorans]
MPTKKPDLRSQTGFQQIENLGEFSMQSPVHSRTNVKSRTKTSGADFAASAPPAHAAKSPAALPCLETNNSIQSYRPTAQKASKLIIAEAVLELIQIEGIETILFGTLTFPKPVTLKEAQKAWNSAASNAIRPAILKGCRILEPHKSRQPHYHLVIATGQDVRRGFDFDAYQEARAHHWASAEGRKATRIYGASANDELREWWTFFRRLERFGFGRSEAVPIYKAGEAAAEYASKYVSDLDRPIEFRGARLYAPINWKPSTKRGFGFVESGRAWRLAVAKIAQDLGFTSEADFRREFGSNWAWGLRGTIFSIAQDIKAEHSQRAQNEAT